MAHLHRRTFLTVQELEIPFVCSIFPWVLEIENVHTKTFVTVFANDILRDFVGEKNIFIFYKYRH